MAYIWVRVRNKVNTIHIPGYLPCVVNFSVFAIIAIRIS